MYFYLLLLFSWTKQDNQFYQKLRDTSKRALRAMWEKQDVGDKWLTRKLEIARNTLWLLNLLLLNTTYDDEREGIFGLRQIWKTKFSEAVMEKRRPINSKQATIGFNDLNTADTTFRWEGEQDRRTQPMLVGPQVHSEFQTTLLVLSLTPNKKNSLEMQQGPLCFAVSWKYFSYLKYSLKYRYWFLLPLCFYPYYDQYDYLICFKIYSSSAIFPLWN